MVRPFIYRDGNRMPFRPNQIIAASVFAFVFIWFTYTSVTGTSSPKPKKEPPSDPEIRPIDDPTAVRSVLGHHGIKGIVNPDIQMARIHVSVTQDSVPALPLSQPLDIRLPSSTQFNISDEFSMPPEPASTSLRISYLPQSQNDASEFIFGVATTYERLYDSLDTMSHWLSNTNTRLIAAMEPSLDADLPTRVLEKAKSLHIPLGTFDSPYQFLDRYFSLIQVLHQHRLPSTKWYVLIDDDTFFLDFPRMVSTITTKYNSSESYYIGALTEDFQQMSNWGYMAYGGGGVFLSAPLLEQLLPNWDACYSHRNTGDRMLAECIYQHTTTKFTWEHNLHQLDLHGDQSGFYEALRPQPLSVHHWKGADFKFQHDMRNLSLVSSVCGSSCLLQKFRFANDWILTNGYSIVKYSGEDMRHRDIGTDISMERTWEYYWPGAGHIHFEHTLGPIRKTDEDGKISFRMESALSEQDGRRVRQLYVKRKTGGEVEGVVEVTWSSG